MKFWQKRKRELPQYWPSCEACEGNMGRYPGDADYFMRCEQCGNEQAYTAEEMQAMQPELERTHDKRTRRFHALFPGSEIA